MIIDIATQLGEYVHYRASSPSRINYIKRYLPKKLSAKKLIQIFKHDFCLDEILEKLSDVRVYYIERLEGKGDELYYFSVGDKLFHGQKVWTQYHPFTSILTKIPPTHYIENNSWFVGSRNNYTHQLIDFIPNLIYKHECFSSGSTVGSCNVYGKNNAILNSLSEIEYYRRKFTKEDIYLSTLGTPINIGGWQIRCIHFRSLYLLKHISIFKSFDLIRSSFSGLHCKNKSTGSKNILMLNRSDNRVLNHSVLNKCLQQYWDVDDISNIHLLSFIMKKHLFSQYSCAILPPGSDNINGFCFSNSSTKLIQLSPISLEAYLTNPFYSYAGLRYALPFLDRYHIIEKESDNNSLGDFTGSWDPIELKTVLMRILGE